MTRSVLNGVIWFTTLLTSGIYCYEYSYWISVGDHIYQEYRSMLTMQIWFLLLTSAATVLIAISISKVKHVIDTVNKGRAEHEKV